MAGQSINRYFGLSEIREHFARLKRFDRASGSFRIGYRYFRKKNYLQALAHFTVAIEIAYDSPIFYLHRGRTYKQMELYEQALADFSCAIMLNPRYLNAHLETIAISILKKDYQNVVTICSTYLAFKPNNFTFLTKRSAAYFLLREFVKAHADLERTLKLRPKNAYAYELLGQIYSIAKDYPRALQSYEQVIKLKPKQGNAYVQLGSISLHLENFAQTIAFCTRAIQLNPADPSAYFYRARAYYNKKAYEQALLDCESALAISSQCADAYGVRGLVAYQQQQYEQALADFEKARQLGHNLFWLDDEYRNTYSIVQGAI